MLIPRLPMAASPTTFQRGVRLDAQRGGDFASRSQFGGTSWWAKAAARPVFHAAIVRPSYRLAPIARRPFWVARIRTKAGAYRQHRLGFAAGDKAINYDMAVRKARLWFAELRIRSLAADEKHIGVRTDLIICPIGEVFSIGHSLQHYVEWKRVAAAKSHFQTNLSLINYYLVPRFANLPMAEFNGEVLQRFVREVLETAPKRGDQPVGHRRSLDSLDEDALRKRKKTANTLISILRVAFVMAWENGKFDSDRPIRCLRHIPHVDRPRILHLSRDECRRLLEVCRPDLGRLVLAALYTGCRATEILRMRCSQVGRDGYGVYVDPLKNYRPRFVFLPDEGMLWFLSLIEGRSPRDLVFKRDSGLPWYGNYKHLFKAAVREAGLPDEFTFHGLRHTYASQLVQAGATVYAVAEQLGHANPTTVLRTYGHLSPQMRESEVRQRFTPLSWDHTQAAEGRHEELRTWRGSLHGGDWRTYAQISEVADFKSTERRQLPLGAKTAPNKKTPG